MAWLKENIIQTLIKEELVSKEELQKVFTMYQDKGGSFLEFFTNQGLLDKETVSYIISKSLDMPIVDVSKVKIDESLLGLLPLDVIKRHKIMPISIVGSVITVAVIDPINVVAVDELKIRTGKQVAVCLTTEAAFNSFLASINQEEGDSPREEDRSGELTNLLEDIKESEEIEVMTVKQQQEGGGDEAEKEEAPVIRLVNFIMKTGVEMKASDIFIEPFEKHMRIRYRVDGILREIESPPKAFHNPIISRIKVMGNMDISEHRIPQDGKFRLKFGNKLVDFRISIVPSSFGEKACLRILDKGAVQLDLDNLGFEETTLEKIKACVRKPHGVFIVTGPTGSGKSTTLYSILRHIYTSEKNIITVEDPVEYQLEGINQVQINSEVGLTFASALRSILRQDPDVILVGEIRDFETMDIAIKAALTGHLVLTTLHTNNAPSAVIRMVNMGIEPFMITASVIGIMGQRLLRRLCDGCKEAYEVPDDVIKSLGLPEDINDSQVFRPRGCPKCFDIGYKGRTNVAEIMPLSSGIRRLIAKNAQEPEIRALAIEEGMKTMRDDAVRKARMGMTSIEEVIRVTTG